MTRQIVSGADEAVNNSQPPHQGKAEVASVGSVVETLEAWTRQPRRVLHCLLLAVNEWAAPCPPARLSVARITVYHTPRKRRAA